MVFHINGPTEPSRPDPVRRQRHPRPAEAVRATPDATDDEATRRKQPGKKDHAPDDHHGAGHHGSGQQGHGHGQGQSQGQPGYGQHAAAYRNADRRMGETDRRRHGETEQNTGWHRLYGLLLEEIDQIDDLDAHQKSRIKKNLRGHLTPHAPPKWRGGAAQNAPPAEEHGAAPISRADQRARPEQSGSGAAHQPDLFENRPSPAQAKAKANADAVAGLNRPAEPVPPPDHTAAAPLSPEQIVSIAAPFPAWVDDEEARENARLSQQLSDCLAQHTGPALRVSNYLQQLLTNGGASRPHVVVDV